MKSNAFAALLTPAGAELLAEAKSRLIHGENQLQVIAALRRKNSAELAAAALSQAQLQLRAQAKFGDQAEQLYFTPAGLEQASRPEVAAHHARRISLGNAGSVLDLCCGIGSDLSAFGQLGLTAQGVDLDPATVQVAETNVAALGLRDSVCVVCADAAAMPFTQWDRIFIDPSRRHSNQRVFNPADYSPPFSFLADLAQINPHVGAKLAPGFPHHMIPTNAEAEWVSYRGELMELALWYGDLATAQRRATLLPSGATLTGAGIASAEVGPLGRWLYEPDPSIIRSHLINELADLQGSRLLDSSIAYLTADHLVQTPFAKAYEITDSLPFSVKQLRQLLRTRRVGSVTIKKRGIAVTPEQLRPQLRLTGDNEATVVLTRVVGKPTMLVCHQLTNSAVVRNTTSATDMDESVGMSKVDGWAPANTN